MSMAIWEPLPFTDHTGAERLVLFRISTTGVPVFCPDWVQDGPQFSFNALDGERALEEAMNRAAQEDTVDGYRRAAKYRKHLDAIRSKRLA